MELVLAGIALVVAALGLAALRRRRRRRAWTTVTRGETSSRPGIRLLESHEVPDRVRRAAEQEERLARLASERAARYLALVPEVADRAAPAPPTQRALRSVPQDPSARSAG